MEPVAGLWDYLLLPLYLFIIYRFAFVLRDRWYPEGHPWRRYFITGLTLKIAGSLFICFIYLYYYGGGDTVNYYLQGNVLNSAFGDSPGKWLNLVLQRPAWYDSDYIDYISRMPWYTAANTWIVVVVSAIAGIFTFNTFLNISLVFAVLSYTGMWALFRTFSKQYPQLTKPIALAILYVPSTLIWGSGIFKDTLCLFGLGWLTYGVFQILLKRNFAPGNLLMTVVGFLLIATAKIYILAAFLPALLLWVLFTYSHNIRSGFARVALKLGIFGLVVVAFPLVTSTFSDSLGKYSIDNVIETSEVTRVYLEQVSESQDGSGYSLGEIDPSIGGMLKKLPLAVNVTLFRPYLWEARKPIIFLNAIEAALFLYVTIRLFFKLGFAKIWRAINTDPNIQFALIFTVIFGFAVGISTYNFGSLSRYRIPCLPLYALALVLINYKYRDPAESIFR